MLVAELAKRPNVEAIMVLDKEASNELYVGNPKVTHVQSNTCELEDWKPKAKEFNPTVVIHAAWQIRQMFGKENIQHEWNIGGSNAVFDFAFETASVRRIIHFSSVASYGAFATNSIDQLFVETDSLRKTDYLYAEEKRVAEEHLKTRHAAACQRGVTPRVFVLRPASITGPRAKLAKAGFGLQSALTDNVQDGNAAQRFVAKMLSFVPITPHWCRQFVHEDDVVDMVALIAAGEDKTLPSSYEAFNVCPPGPVMRGEDMAAAVGKKAVTVHPILIRIAFFLARNLTGGRIPTSVGGWRTYSYPIAVDGSKATKVLGYAYKYGPQESFVTDQGRYAPAPAPVPENKA